MLCLNQQSFLHSKKNEGHCIFFFLNREKNKHLCAVHTHYRILTELKEKFEFHMLSNTFDYTGKFFSVLGIHIPIFLCFKSDSKTIPYSPFHSKFCQLHFPGIDKFAESKVANVSEE